MEFQRPFLDIIRTDEQLNVEVINNFDNAVYANPSGYAATIRKLGGHSMGFTDLYPDPEQERVTACESSVQHFFDGGYDQIIAFDDTTEDKLAEDIHHQQLITTFRKQKSIDSHEGTMKVVRRENPHATVARDSVRWSRLYRYVCSMLEWQEAGTSDLKSAG